MYAKVLKLAYVFVDKLIWKRKCTGERHHMDSEEHNGLFILFGQREDPAYP
jgi:hypothetical protein